MDVILLENVKNLGKLGDKVAVKAGYGRNYLIPYNKAVFATIKNTQLFEQKRTELELTAQQLLATAKQRAVKLNDITLTVTAMATDEGKLYGSVGPNEIREALKSRSIEVQKREIVMSTGPIYLIGDYLVDIQLHGDVIAKLQVQVIPS